MAPQAGMRLESSAAPMISGRSLRDRTGDEPLYLPSNLPWDVSRQDEETEGKKRSALVAGRPSEHQSQTTCRIGKNVKATGKSGSKATRNMNGLGYSAELFYNSAFFCKEAKAIICY